MYYESMDVITTRSLGDILICLVSPENSDLSFEYHPCSASVQRLVLLKKVCSSVITHPEHPHRPCADFCNLKGSCM